MLLTASTSGARASAYTSRARAPPSARPSVGGVVLPPRPTLSIARSLKADVGVDSIHDWRGKQMQEAIDTYFTELWSKGKTEAADALLADDAVHIDEIWGGGSDEVVAGRAAIKAFVTRVRSAYPDFWVAADSYGQCGSHRMFVRWAGAATNLGAYHGHKPSRHASAVSGIDLFTFSDDRSAITEVLVYRTPLAEDRVELSAGAFYSGDKNSGSGSDGHGLHELRLNRLHDEPPKGRKA